VNLSQPMVFVKSRRGAFFRDCTWRSSKAGAADPLVRYCWLGLNIPAFLPFLDIRYGVGEGNETRKNRTQVPTVSITNPE